MWMVATTMTRVRIESEAAAETQRRMFLSLLLPQLLTRCGGGECDQVWAGCVEEPQSGILRRRGDPGLAGPMLEPVQGKGRAHSSGLIVPYPKCGNDIVVNWIP